MLNLDAIFAELQLNTVATTAGVFVPVRSAATKRRRNFATPFRSDPKTLESVA